MWSAYEKCLFLFTAVIGVRDWPFRQAFLPEIEVENPDFTLSRWIDRYIQASKMDVALRDS